MPSIPGSLLADLGGRLVLRGAGTDRAGTRAVPEPGLYRFLAYPRTAEDGAQTPARMVDHATGIEHVFDKSGHIAYIELGCGHDPARVQYPDQHIQMSLVGREDAGILHHQRLTGCPPPFEPTSCNRPTETAAAARRRGGPSGGGGCRVRLDAAQRPIPTRSAIDATP